jgi:molybdenum cofactor cytidylyltransferase
VAGVVLAAGGSKRLGRPKQTVIVGGKTLVERAVGVAMEAGLTPVIVVLRDSTLVERMKELGAQPLLNRRWDEGMASSIGVGVSWAKALGAFGVVLMTCDQVALRGDHLRGLSAVEGRITGSRYGGRIGIPAYFPAASFAALLELKGDVGARELLIGAATVEDESLGLDVDTEEDVRQAETLFGAMG